MDPFGPPPAELCILILGSLHSPDDIRRATHASPAVLRVREACEPSILRKFLRGLFPGDLLQDALAIHDFPRPTCESFRTSQRHAAIDKHLRTWGAKELPNPWSLPTGRWDMVHDLFRLHQKLWLFVKDYLDKATSRSSLTASSHYPVWSHPSFHLLHPMLTTIHTRTRLEPSAYEEKRAEEVNDYDEALLSDRSRRYLLQAFLRYELLCKVYGPVESLGSPWHQYQVTDFGRFIRPTNPEKPTDGLFCVWDWMLLDKYERNKSIISPNAISCVRGYAHSLMYTLALPGLAYGFTQPRSFQGDATSDSRPRPTPCKPRCIHKDERSGNVIVRESPGDLARLVVSFMASAGFNLLYSTLKSDYNHFVPFLERLVQDMDSQRLATTNATSPQLPTTADRAARPTWKTPSETLMYRLRAVPFLRLEERPAPACLVESGDASPSRAQSWPLPEVRHRDEFICHGEGVLAYEALNGRLDPFWKQ